ncbi:MAG TPA: DUF6157 family protein [Chloroflexaceae bacterium]|nr:DUF6157 family protein [Chloroflexaceae bacterium]
MHTTNYTSAFIEVAEDCKAATGTAPPEKPTLARMQYDMLHAGPYRYTSDELIFAIYALRNNIAEDERELRRAEFFSKGQPCLRSSPLAKTYGWGLHFDGASRVAIYPRGSEEYARLQRDPSLKHLKAMRNAR